MEWESVHERDSARVGDAPFGVSALFVLLFILLMDTMSSVLCAAAADLSDPHTEYRYALDLEHGKNGPPSFQKAAWWLRKSAKAGYAPAQAELGALYDKGEGVPKDVVQAATWYRKAARQGNIRAMTNLAWDYVHGQGVIKNLGRALIWYRRAADKGSPRAQNNLGVLYLKGRGVARDENKARRWFLKAARQHYAIAETNVGILYANGQGVPRNQKIARIWFRRAARNGNQVAEESLGEITAPEAFPPYIVADPTPVGQKDPAPSLSLDTHSPAIVPASRTMPPLAASLSPVFPDVDHPILTQKVRSEDFGVVIGVEQYPKPLPPAPYAAHDVQATIRMMRAMGIPPDHIRALLGDGATLARIRSALTWLGRNVRPDSTVWIYYSGHGTRNEKGQTYLVPYDGDPTDLADTGLALGPFLDTLRRLPARRIIVALDSCFSGTGERSVIPAGARPLVFTEEPGITVGRKQGTPFHRGHLILLTASTGSEEAGILPEAQHGLFTYYLLRGLEGAAAKNGHLTLSDLYGYLRPKVSEQAALQNREQIPAISPFPLEGKENLTLR